MQHNNKCHNTMLASFLSFNFLKADFSERDYKVWRLGLQSVLGWDYKVWRKWITKCGRDYKVWQAGLQSVAGITKCGGITK